MTPLFESPLALMAEIIAALICLGLATFLYLGLRNLVLSIRSWLTAKSWSAEKDAVGAAAHYQGPFHVQRPGAVRQRFARRLEIRFHNHWACAGKWVPWD